MSLTVRATHRLLVEADLPWVVALEATSFDSAWPAEAFVAELRLPFGLGIAAVGEGGEPLGYLLARSLYEEAHLLKIAVDPASKRLGVGAGLLAHYEDLVVQRGAERSVVDVRVGNLAARALYASAGYEILLERPRYYSNGDDALLLLKHLKTPDEGEHDDDG